MSISRTGKKYPLRAKQTIETRAKRSISLTGNKNALGCKYPASFCDKQSIRMMGNRNALGNKFKRPLSTCPHCNKQGSNNLMKRYHFDNCKNKI